MAAIWVHITQVPDPIRGRMDQISAAYRLEAERIEQSTVKTLRQELLKSYIPQMVDAVVSEGQSLRAGFKAVALQMGLSDSYIQQLYYAARKPI